MTVRAAVVDWTGAEVATEALPERLAARPQWMRRQSAAARQGLDAVLPAGSPRSRWSVSLAHSGELTASAACPAGSRVGVDVEPVSAENDVLWQRMLADGEQQAGSATLVISLKEAAHKALRLDGLHHRRLRTEIDGHGPGTATVTWLPESQQPQVLLARWWLRDGIVVTVASDCPEVEPLCWLPARELHSTPNPWKGSS